MKTIVGGELYIDGHKAESLVETFGTPLLVLSEDEIRTRAQNALQAFTKIHSNARVAYAGKAFLSLAMCKLAEEEGLCLDVVSGGELFTAIKAGFPGERIEMNGNNKSKDELSMALDYGVGRIILDGSDEIDLLENILKENKGGKAKVLLRINPGVDSHTHSYITTGNRDSKFGTPLDKEILYPLLGRLINSKQVEFLGFHFHVGSQLLDNRSHLLATKKLMESLEEIRQDLGFTPSELNLGGGFGIAYTDKDEEKPFSYFLEPMVDLIKEKYESWGISMPALVIEPGRSLVGTAGTTLYTVGTIKRIPGGRTYVSVDGGMTDNIRPALYDAEYECCLATVQDQTSETVTISGKCCESGDILIKDVELPTVKRGDILAVFATGAYCYAMSSNYNKLPRPAVIMTTKNAARCIIKRQSYEDLISGDLIY